jgi:transmembrane sensor
MDDQIKSLFQRFEQGNASDADLATLQELLSHDHTLEHTEALTQFLEVTGGTGETLSDADLNRMCNQLALVRNTLDAVDVPKTKVLRFAWMRVAAAAILVCMVVSGSFIWYQNNKSNTSTSSIITTLPSNASAALTLTLADGTTVALDSNASLNLKEAGAHISQINEEGLVYQSISSQGPTAYNTLQIPAGRQYQLTLSDGTKVWLNTTTSIRYPVTFQEDNREVFIEGEAYFEVAPHASKPFIVHTATQRITVLGTSFNVASYPKEPHTTSLISGKVQISTQDNLYDLKPGQQLISDDQISSYLQPIPTIDEVIAWKSGFFQINNRPLQSMLQEVARWYDIEIEYRSKKAQKNFNGRIDRKNTIENIVTALRASGILCELHDNTLVIL